MPRRKQILEGLVVGGRSLVLADEDLTAYFTKTHIADLQATIASNDEHNE